MTREEIIAIVKEAADAAAKKAVAQTFVSLGVDPNDPIALQRDFAHMRKWRTASDTIKDQGLRTAIVVVVTSSLAWLGYTLKQTLGTP